MRVRSGSSVMVPPGAMDMAVRRLFRRCGANIQDLDIEAEGLPGEWMVGIDIRGVPAH